MKFRAVAKNYDSIQCILKSFQAATKLTTNVVFNIDPNEIQLFADPSYQDGHLLSRCVLPKETLFSEYLFKGINSEHNRIFFDVKCDSLSQILHSVQINSIKSLKLKLTNGRDGRFILAISVEYPSFESSRFIDYNVYISLINRKYWNTFEEQPMDSFQISVYLPNFKQLATTIEKLASMAQFAIITAKRQADSGANFSISLCNETISIKSKYNNLKLNDAANINGGGSGGEDCKYKIRIDIRKLHSVFSALSSIKPTTIYASIGHESVICFYYLNDLISFKIVLPNYDQ